jgi:ubiquinone/menaquinone biosynthesis C-methylase UbiE
MSGICFNNLINNIVNKIVYEPLEKIRQILKLTLQILICLIIVMIIPLTIIITVVCYFSFLYLKSNFYQYEKLIDILHNVKCNETSDFMNYGYWDKENITLLEANKNLCRIIQQRGELDEADNILDVGCGYGEQDFLWCESVKGKIHAMDINNVSIEKAENKNKKLKKNIHFFVGNACKLNCKKNFYDRVVSLESAFHYNPRINFLNESYRVLKKGGKLVIADILYNSQGIDIFNSLNRSAFEKVFNIPSSNKISIDEFKHQLEGIGFSVEIEDISDKTFKPYYKYFFDNVEYSDSMMIPKWSYDIIKSTVSFYINNICGGTNGFKYVIAVCEKK